MDKTVELEIFTPAPEQVEALGIMAKLIPNMSRLLLTPESEDSIFGHNFPELRQCVPNIRLPQNAHVYEQDAYVNKEQAELYNKRMKKQGLRGAPKIQAGKVRVYYSGIRWDVVLVNKEVN